MKNLKLLFSICAILDITSGREWYKYPADVSIDCLAIEKVSPKAPSIASALDVPKEIRDESVAKDSHCGLSGYLKRRNMDGPSQNHISLQRCADYCLCTLGDSTCKSFEWRQDANDRRLGFCQTHVQSLHKSNYRAINVKRDEQATPRFYNSDCFRIVKRIPQVMTAPATTAATPPSSSDTGILPTTVSSASDPPSSSDTGILPTTVSSASDPPSSASVPEITTSVPAPTSVNGTDPGVTPIVSSPSTVNASNPEITTIASSPTTVNASDPGITTVVSSPSSVNASDPGILTVVSSPSTVNASVIAIRGIETFQTLFSTPTISSETFLSNSESTSLPEANSETSNPLSTTSIASDPHRTTFHEPSASRTKLPTSAERASMTSAVSALPKKLRIESLISNALFPDEPSGVTDSNPGSNSDFFVTSQNQVPPASTLSTEVLPAASSLE